MVRLLPPAATNNTATPTFQSHNGAIAATPSFCLFTPAYCVSIPQWCDCCLPSWTTSCLFYYRFNPTMVRLLQDVISRIKNCKQWFQSHNGAIAARRAVCPKDCRIRFQSHNGAIAAVTVGDDIARRLLSIPQWCDCCSMRCPSRSPAAPPFNPTMVRLLLQRFVSNISITSAFNPTMVRLLLTDNSMDILTSPFQSHNGAIAAKAKFWGLRAKGKEMVKGLQSTFGCLKTLRGSTATELSKLGYFGLKLPPHLYLAFKVLKTA